MRYRFEVDLEDSDGNVETLNVPADLRDVREWEARNDKSAMVEKPSWAQFIELAFLASKRAGKFTGNLSEWQSQCADVREVSKESEAKADARPTRKGRGGGSSQR